MSKPEETAEREKNAEVIHLKSDVVGAGQAGDVIIHNPDHPNPALRLCRVVPIDAGLLSVIKESVSEEPQEPARRESDQLHAHGRVRRDDRGVAAARSWGQEPPCRGRRLLGVLRVDQTSEPWKVTRQGAYLLTDLAGDAKKGLERLEHMEGGMLHKYLPKWCMTQLSDIRGIVDRAAWMLWAGSEAANNGRDVCSDPPDSPYNVAYPVSSMVGDAYRDLCGKVDEYEAAERVAIEKQYEDMGYIRQPNGEWHPTKAILAEMNAEA